MIYKLNEEIYKKYKGYSFISQTFLNNNKKVVYCFVAKKSKNVECLIQQLYPIENNEKDKVISDYLNYKVKTFALDGSYAKAKGAIKLTSFNQNN